MSNSLWSHRLWPFEIQKAWHLASVHNSPGKNTGVGSRFFLSSGYLPDPRIEPGSPAVQADSLLSEPPGKMWPRAKWLPKELQPTHPNAVTWIGVTWGPGLFPARWASEHALPWPPFAWVAAGYKGDRGVRGFGGGWSVVGWERGITHSNHSSRSLSRCSTVSSDLAYKTNSKL